MIRKGPSPEATETARSARLPLITGDVTDASVLRSAGVTRARAVVAVTSDDIKNVEAGMGARSVAPSAQIVLRLGDNDLAERVARRLGLDASYSVSFASAGVFAAALMERSVIATVPVGRRVLLIAEVRLSRGCELDSSTVSVIDRPGRCRVFGVAGHGDATRLPDPSRELHTGDVILIAATRAGLAGVLVAAQGGR